MSNLKDSEFIAVRLSAIEYLKEKFPTLCETSGLCEQVAGRLYTVTKLRTEESCIPVTVSEKGRPDEDGNNYCHILTILGMEEEGDPVAEVQRLKDASEKGSS